MERAVAGTGAEYSSALAIDGGADADTLAGGSGNDTINGGDGANTVNGNNGNDNLTSGMA